MPLPKHLMHAILITGLLTGLTLATRAVAPAAAAPPPPTQAQISSAEETADLLFNTLFAALSQEFAETTMDNVEQGKQSISLVFNNANKAMRLVGTLAPLLGGGE